MEIGARSSESFITTLSSYIICRSQSCSAKWVWMAGTQLWLLCSWLASHRCTRRPGEQEGTFQTAVSNYSFCPCLSTYLPAILISHFPWLIATAISNLPPHKRRRKWSFHSTLWHLWQISFFRVKAAWELCFIPISNSHMDLVDSSAPVVSESDLSRYPCIYKWPRAQPNPSFTSLCPCAVFSSVTFILKPSDLLCKKRRLMHWESKWCAEITKWLSKATAGSTSPESWLSTSSTQCRYTQFEQLFWGCRCFI